MHNTSHTVLRILAILAYQEISTPEVAEAVGVTQPTARKILNQLAADGYVIQGPRPRRRYRFTDAGKELGMSMSAGTEMQATADIEHAATRLASVVERVLTEQATARVHEALGTIGASADIAVRVRLQGFSIRS